MNCDAAVQDFLQAKLEQENRKLKMALGERYQFENIVRRRKAMQDVLAQRCRSPPTTGHLFCSAGARAERAKELIARAIHQSRPRREGAMVRVNSGALPDTLLESELFGHEKGSFTGAHATHQGKFEMAGGGTIFLDEIGDISPAMQVKLLRVLQEKEFARVGGKATIRTDARVIAATNPNLEEPIENRIFREDCIIVFRYPIYIPPLRARRKTSAPGGILPQEIRTRERGARSDVADLFMATIGGNIRELENVIERASIVMQSDELSMTTCRLSWRPEQASFQSIDMIFRPRNRLRRLQRSVIQKASNAGRQ
jgi:transcriptional regulator with GAF, ATPase, and Fis domain